jgi:purine-nucleoside phosphorylase
MNAQITLDQIKQTASVLRARLTIAPRVGLILGSGLNALADSVENAQIIPFRELPNWPLSTVMGHSGQLVVGILEGQPVLVMQGRVHYYEGYSMSQVTMPVRVMQMLKMETIIVTNAAGGINPDFTPGDVMLITDHPQPGGHGGRLTRSSAPIMDEIGPRFPDMSQAYDRAYMDLARDAAKREGILLREGVYAGLSGPSFETPADLRFLRVAGADSVGMSTVPEVTVARHGGMRVLGFSGISNKANLDGSTITTHEEVMEAGRVITPKMEKIIRGFLRSL